MVTLLVRQVRNPWVGEAGGLVVEDTLQHSMVLRSPQHSTVYHRARLSHQLVAQAAVQMPRLQLLRLDAAVDARLRPCVVCLPPSFAASILFVFP